MSWTLQAIKGALEGVFPSTLATTGRDGTVNLVFVSQVHHVDDDHVAFSEQFLKRTLDNLIANPRAQAFVVDPTTARQFRVDLAYVRRETEGPTVTRMRAKLEGIARATGMADVFALRAAVVCRVTGIRPVGVSAAPGSERARPTRVPAARHLGDVADAIASAEDLEELTETLLGALSDRLGYRHAALWLLDDASSSLLAVGSRGFPESGIGGEIALGDSLVGQCAATRVPIRISALSRERTYARAARAGARDIAPPGLPDAESFLAVPLVAKRRALGVLVVESRTRLAFDEEDEATLRLVAHLAGASIALLHGGGEAPTDAPIRVRIYEEDDSVFVDDEYVVKGTAGRLLGVMLALARERGRFELTNRELRLDPRSKLSPLNDNLEARLLLLRRRLEERSPRLRVTSVGRGRLRLELDADFTVERIPSGGA